MKYHPDCWIMLKLTNSEKETHYRIFANWYGGYLNGDSWKLNSGVEKVTIENQIYLFEGTSKSVYSCNINNYSTSGYGSSVLNSLINQSKDSVTIEPLSLEQMKDIVNSIFKKSP